jgi:hypothetical protein
MLTNNRRIEKCNLPTTDCENAIRETLRLVYAWDRKWNTAAAV